MINFKEPVKTLEFELPQPITLPSLDVLWDNWYKIPLNLLRTIIIGGAMVLAVLAGVITPSLMASLESFFQ